MDVPFLHMTVLELVKSAGYVGLFLIIFAESSLFFSFFLPGSSLLFTAGVLAGQGWFNIYILVALLALAAILGDSFGYWFGSKIGPAIFTKDDSRFFNKKHLKRTELFYEKHGSKAIVIGRFIPIIRTFVPMLAGIGRMKYGIFLVYNIVGGVLWSVGVTVAGFALGKSVSNIEHYILPIVLIIIGTSLLPVVLESFKKDDNGKQKTL